MTEKILRGADIAKALAEKAERDAKAEAAKTEAKPATGPKTKES